MYRERGRRNGPTLSALDVTAGLVEGATPAMAYRIALGYAKGGSRDLVEDLHATHRHAPSRTTIERIAKSIGTKAKEQTDVIENRIRRREALPSDAHAVAIGLDRTSVPMEEKRDPNAPVATRAKSRKKPYVRAKPAPVVVNYRMAYVCTVSVVDDNGAALTTKKYFASAAEGASGILHRAMLDVRHLRQKHRRQLPLVVVQDGAPELWNKMRKALRRERSVGTWHEAVDEFHVLEHLSKALAVVETDDKKRTHTQRLWASGLAANDDTIDKIEAFLVEKSASASEKEQALLAVETTYIKNNKDRMRYASLRAKGFPVGSGVTEGACKSLVMMRAKRSGQRWHAKGVDAALTLRALHQSERLPLFWQAFSAGYRQEVGVA